LTSNRNFSLVGLAQLAFGESFMLRLMPRLPQEIHFVLLCVRLFASVCFSIAQISLQFI
jgi:hypothetical protein